MSQRNKALQVVDPSKLKGSNGLEKIGDAGGDTGEQDRRIKYRDPYQQYELLCDLAQHHQKHAHKVEVAKQPDLKQDQTVEQAAMMHRDFLQHPLLAGKPYFNGMDPKVTSLPSETQLTDSPEYNDARNELRLQKSLREEKKLQQALDKERSFHPKPNQF